ncbi:MAG TPA: response regulator [Phycisphaerae bacterium]|nr:response regulator [Phycisphaerales bacterium]HRX84252.1 response regulator [Phycisphaerae bacterium]
MPAEKPPILVVDDNPATLYGTVRILRAAGWQVVEASTGAEALAAAERGVELVVLDVNLPDMDGFEVCRRLRGVKSSAHTPILHISATAVEDADRVQGLESGADGYLVRPVEPPVLLATVRALLRARRAEDELRESEAKFRAVFDNALAGIALFNEELEYIDVNPAMCHLLQEDCDCLIGRNVADAVPAEQRARIAEIRQLLKEGQTWTGMFPLRAKDGSTVYLEWNISRHTRPGVCLAMAMDITDRLKIEQERERLLVDAQVARAEAENANRLKDDFLATLSHELRTPLNAMIGWAQLLRRGATSEDDLAQGLDIIERNARIQARLISDLLDVSRITSGKLQLNLQTVAPRTIIASAIEMSQPLADAKSIRIEQCIPENDGAVTCDGARLQQVLSNLLSNAVKFTPEGGRITVTLRADGAAIAIAVTDNGRGIAPQMLPHIFERFRQAESASTREQGGLGLGLTIAKSLTEAHGGVIRADSPGLGKGATFEITLPQAPPGGRRDAPEQADRLSRAPAAPALRDVRVLVVEDNPDGCELFRRILADAGAAVFTANAVQPALAAIDTFRPDVLVSDIRMPGRDGYDLIRAIRARDDAFAKLPAIALTAFARLEDRDRALQAGFRKHLTKPVDEAELLDAVATLAQPALPG